MSAKTNGNGAMDEESAGVEVKELKGRPTSVTFLGTSSGGGPIVSRNCSSLALNLDESLWLFDCAEGTQVQFHKCSLKMSKISRIFITHMHADHIMGLAPLLGTVLTGIATSAEDRAKIAAQGVKKKAQINIYGPPGLRLFVREVLNLTALTLGGVYAVHELIPRLKAGEEYASTSPNGEGNGPSCGCGEGELQGAEAVGQNLEADEDGCWRDVVGKAEGKSGEDGGKELWTVHAGPIDHRIMSLGYVINEPPLYEPVDIDRYLPLIESNMPALEAQTPPIRHPRQVITRLSRTHLPYTLPDGKILEPPAISSAQPRKVVVFGDCSGTNNSALLELAKSPSLLVHESTNAWIDPEIEKGEKGKRARMEELEKSMVRKVQNESGTQNISDLGKVDGKGKGHEATIEEGKERVRGKAAGRGHSSADMTGSFARKLGAKRVAVNHFSAMFPSPTYSSNEPFPSLTSPMTYLPPTRPLPPFPPNEILRRIINANIENQITAAWAGSESDDVSFKGTFMPRAVAARDLMTLPIPSHELAKEEEDDMLRANEEAMDVENTWRADGASGVAVSKGIKIVGLWLDKAGNASSSRGGRGGAASTSLARASSSKPYSDRAQGEDHEPASEVSVDEVAATPVDWTVSISNGKSKVVELQDLSKDQLIEKIRKLEARVKASKEVEGVAEGSTGGSEDVKAVKVKKNKRLERVSEKGPSKFHRNPTRHIALLFTYHGWPYSGLAIQNVATPLPTVEGELLKALEKTHLIEEGKGWEGCKFSRCGRTDRGVSSAGQVVNLWIKSKRQIGDGGSELNVGGDWRPAQQQAEKKTADGTQTREEELASQILGDKAPYTEEELARMKPAKRKRELEKALIPKPTDIQEFSYPHILNRVLPQEIRVLAWSPLPSEPGADEDTHFNSRFSCITRHYRYFFSRRPLPGQPPLDIPLMQQAAQKLLGEHDFRNFCKVDGSKQIDNHCRRVLRAIIRRDDGTPLPDVDPGIGGAEDVHGASIGHGQDDFVFELIGSAFLWHQVRHIMSVLFHVGHGFEKPDIVTSLLNTGWVPAPPTDREEPASEAGKDDEATGRPEDYRGPDPLDCDTEPLAGKPVYQMASGLPLQLYRCGYKEGAVDWRFSGYDGPMQGKDDERAKSSESSSALLTTLKSQAEESRIRARQIQAFYEEAVRINTGPDSTFSVNEQKTIFETPVTSLTLGGGDIYSAKKYVKFMERELTDTVEEQNRRWREGKGEAKRLRKLQEREEAEAEAGEGKGDAA